MIERALFATFAVALLAVACGGAIDPAGVDESGQPLAAGAVVESGQPADPPPPADRPPCANMPDAGACGDCAEGFVCCAAPEPCAGRCVLDCRSGPPCFAGSACDPATGVCELLAPPPRR